MLANLNTRRDNAIATPKHRGKAQLILYSLAVLFALLASARVWGPGMVNTRGGGDSPFLLQRTLDMAENLRYGIFPPRWMAHAAYDLGYPFFNHYAALPYYLSGGLTVLGINPIVAVQTTQTFGFILAALAMALWAQQIYPHSQAATLVAVAAYTFAPFHMVNVYVRGDSLSEFYAFIWYPLILWALGRLAKRFTWQRILVAALAYGALILTHNVSAMIFSPFAVLYAILVTLPQTNVTRAGNARYFQQVKRWVVMALPFIWGMLLTTWFWLPAIGETKYGQMGEEFTAGYFHYSRHFRGLNLVQPSLLFNYSVALRAEDAGPFTMGLIQALLALLGVAVLIWLLLRQYTHKPKDADAKSQRSTTVAALYGVVGLTIASLMITPLSSPLWDHLPVLPITQFPWRFLSVQALFTAIVTGALANLNTRSKQSNAEAPSPQRASTVQIARQGWLPLLLIMVLVLSTFLSLHPDRLLITKNDVTWDKLLLYETFTGNIGTTIRYEYLPRDVVPRLYISEAVVSGNLHVTSDGGVPVTAKLIKRTPNKQIWTVTLDNGAATVVFPLNWWPGWQATVTGQATETRPLVGSGRLALDLIEGTHTVTLRLRNTPLRTWANVVSLLAVLIVPGLAILEKTFDFLRSSENQKTPTWANACSIIVYLIGLLLLALILCALLNQIPALPHTGYAFDFLQMPYPHRGALEFDVVKLWFEPLFVEAAPGETISIPLHGGKLTPSAPPLMATVRLVSPAAPRHDVPYTLAQTAFRLSEGAEATTIQVPKDLSLTLPEGIARGLYLVEFRVESPQQKYFARTPQGHAIGPVYIGTVRVPQGAASANTTAYATFKDIQLLAVEGLQSSSEGPDTLKLKLTWALNESDTNTGTPRNWSLSLRLLDATGRQITQRDLQPGYGYLPTTLWRPGEKVTDYPVLSLPEGLAPGNYIVRVITYLQATMEGGGESDVYVKLHETTRCDLENSDCPDLAPDAPILCEAGGVRLVSLDLPKDIAEGSALDGIGVWHVAATPETDAAHKVRLDLSTRWEMLDATGAPVAVAAGPLAPGSQTTTWLPQTLVRSPFHIAPPATLPDQPYSLRLTLLDGGETQATCIVADTLPIAPRPRIFEAPPLAHTQIANFGDIIKLLGYDVEQSADTLLLTLWWQAMATKGHDYKRFVHVYDPATEQITSQDDAMPRDWIYPTGWWVDGEVVSETITLDLSAAPPGDYHIGVGWYEPETVGRLPARDAEGNPYPMNRVTLDTPIRRK